MDERHNFILEIVYNYVLKEEMVILRVDNGTRNTKKQHLSGIHLEKEKVKA